MHKSIDSMSKSHTDNDQTRVDSERPGRVFRSDLKNSLLTCCQVIHRHRHDQSTFWFLRSFRCNGHLYPCVQSLCIKFLNIFASPTKLAVFEKMNIIQELLSSEKRRAVTSGCGNPSSVTLTVKLSPSFLIITGSTGSFKTKFGDAVK